MTINDNAINIRLPKEVKDNLKLLAKKDNRKLSDFIRLELHKISKSKTTKQ